MADKEKFIYSEARLAKQIGLPRKELSSARQEGLERGFDWDMENGQIGFCLRGVAKLLAVLQISPAHIDIGSCRFPDHQPGPTPAMLLTDTGQQPTPIRMQVRRLFDNPRLLEVVEVLRPSQLQHVIVRSNANFRIGMQFDAIPDVGNPGYWILNGPLPRFPGRW